MDIRLIYFSQTGNTRQVASTLTETFSARGHTAKSVSYTRADTADFTDSDLIGIGSPCFESQAPSNVRDYLWDLPELEGKRAFVFATSGGSPGKVLYDLAKPLMSKGADIIGGLICRGVCYYPLPCLIGRFPDRPDQPDLIRVQSFAEALLSHISSDTAGPMPESRSDVFHHGFGFYQIVGSLISDTMLRILMPKPKADHGKCTECGWCIEECPTKSMSLTPKPEVSSTCYRCYRCMTGCPEEALSVKWGISNFAVWTLYNQTFEKWFGDVEKGEKLY